MKYLIKFFSGGHELMRWEVKTYIFISDTTISFEAYAKKVILHGTFSIEEL